MHPDNQKQPSNALCILGGHVLTKPSIAHLTAIFTFMVLMLLALFLLKKGAPGMDLTLITGACTSFLGGAFCGIIGLRPERGFSHITVILLVVFASGALGDLAGRILF
jgi:hypothetical protein